jgi:CII-binding regulator of phage lambda lysogenization HflD
LRKCVDEYNKFIENFLDQENGPKTMNSLQRLLETFITTQEKDLEIYKNDTTQPNKDIYTKHQELPQNLEKILNQIEDSNKPTDNEIIKYKSSFVQPDKKITLYKIILPQTFMQKYKKLIYIFSGVIIIILAGLAYFYFNGRK